MKYASMRPRFMNRGSMEIHQPVGQGRARFNEAPIHESGKFFPTSGRPNRRPRRFNEAPIHESGK